MLITHSKPVFLFINRAIYLRQIRGTVALTSFGCTGLALCGIFRIIQDASGFWGAFLYRPGLFIVL